MREEMELERLRAIAEETAKLEEHEACWVRELQELEPGWPTSCRRASPVNMPTTEGYVASTNNGGGGCGVHGRRVDFDDLKAETGCYVEPVRGITVTDNLPTDISNTRLQTAGQGSIVSPVTTLIVSTSQGDRLPDIPYTTTATIHYGPPPLLPLQRLSTSAPVFVPTMSTSGFPGAGGLASIPTAQQVTGEGEAVEPVSTLAVAPLDALLVALLAQQLPTLPTFNGENLDGDGESFSEWLERLELVASTCKWDDQAKLVNVATCLRGIASRFYRSCTPQQRSSYNELVTALRSRFTPVHIQSVQSSIFHEWRQHANETVDDYAQDLRRLFHRAYSSAHSGGEAKAMGKSVLAYQFIAGLVDRLKAKMVGRNGTFEELLVQARFEEARVKNINSSQGGFHTAAGQQSQKQLLQKKTRGCFSCGGTGHYARDCPLHG